MRRIARERIDILFAEAGERASKGQPQLARRYCAMARRISMRYNVPLGSRYRRSYCRRCGAHLLPGRNCTVRLRRGHLNIRCAECSSIMRFPMGGQKESNGDEENEGNDPSGPVSREEAGGKREP
jgi:RNase P subunit RPR2